ncbi:ABC transporter ATP-binding protein [Tissierella pigra]|uniref:ABC transporter ATP-binding protein n=1 Tax=Tissierella pigra TaxID=2607614 RepID=A0A6N7XSF9_9FIRM|nr:ABC transporter ATP-binding protein [Tissierella pigra]MBU5427600.1 ABC transporter ATP-binding protein [Tissierella pigra]MSU00353.1 ABC transporter ATP-binding protein [Tissierella pigra]
MNIIETDNLSKNYGKNRGIIDININVNEGEIFGFIGPNGAGKSTLIRTLLNFIYPTSGSGKIFNKDISRESSSIKELVGYVPSEVKYYSKVYVKDIINYTKGFRKDYSSKEIDSLIYDLEIDVNKRMNELSLGNKKKVAILQSLIGNPQLLILDEPTNGLDPLMQKRLFDILIKMKNEGKTVFLSSHNLIEVENLCDRVAIIKEGRIIDTLELKSTVIDFGRIIELEGDIPKDFIDRISHKTLSIDDNQYKFIYKGDIDNFIKSIASYNIKNLSIRKENLEDNFIKYYEDKEEK